MIHPNECILILIAGEQTSSAISFAMSWFNKLFGLDNEKLGFRSIHEKPILTPFFPPTDVEPPQQRTVEPPHQSTVEAPDKKQSSPQVDERQHLSMDLGFQSSETHVC